MQKPILLSSELEKMAKVVYKKPSGSSKIAFKRRLQIMSFNLDSLGLSIEITVEVVV
jgi:hypothetical protein